MMKRNLEHDTSTILDSRRIARAAVERLRLDNYTRLDLARIAWQAHIQSGKVTNVRRQKIYLSHEVLKFHGIEVIGEVDHKDRDSLNNRFANLRPATRIQNLTNRALGKNNPTGYKGVRFLKRYMKYQARIGTKGSQIHLGYFVDPTEAAKAYDKAAKMYHGKFAYLNFPEST